MEMNLDKNLASMKALMEDEKYVIKDSQRRMFFDKWYGQFNSFIEYAKEKRLQIREINEGYALGSGRPDLDELWLWASSLSMVLHEGIYEYEMLNEIDVNLLELRTEREKKAYLSKVRSALWSLDSELEYIGRTHPDYKSKYSTGYDPKSDVLTKEKLEESGKKYPLNIYYLTLQENREVLMGIAEYVERRMYPEEALVLEHELTAITHKLLLFHKMGLLEPLYLKYRAHIGVVRFAKLIGGIAII